MNDLPLEVHRQIFQYLKQKDLQTCYFVSKSWYSMTIPLNWEKVTLNRRRVNLVKSYLKEPDHSKYFKYGHLLTALAITDPYFPCSEYKKEFNRREFSMLMNLFPNLKELDISRSGQFEEYLEDLMEMDLPHINKITRFFPRDTREAHLFDLLFLVYCKFRDTITSIHLLYNKNTIQHVDVLNSLVQFKQLTELKFCNKLDRDLTPFQLGKMCPHLKVLKCISNYPISDSVMLHLSSINNNGINLNFMRNLTNVELCLPSLSATYTKYLVDYFPNQLNELTIRICRQGIFNWINLVGMELASRLMEKAGKLEVFINFESSDQLEAPDGGETRPTIFFKLLNVFRKTPQSSCKAIFRGNYEDENDKERTGHSFRYTPDGKLSFEYDLRVGPIFSLDLPEKSSSVIGPEAFDSLYFDISGVDYDVVKPILTYSLFHCPGIQSFLFSGNETQIEGRSFYLQYKHQEDRNSSKATHRSITYLEIEHISPVQCYFDLASTYLLDIEDISLRIEDRCSLEDGPVIDLTSFKKLKTFTTEIGYRYDYNEYDNDECNNFVMIEYTDGVEKYYDLEEEEYCEQNDDIDYPWLTIFCNTGVSFDFRKY